METFNKLMESMNEIVWGWWMMGLLLGVGAFLTFGLRFISITKIGYGFRQLFKKRSGEAEEGDVSPFAALMTALSSTVGTGNIAGVAAAIAIGGPGAVFWMWVTAILGTATKFAEGVLAVRYREVDANGNRVGGPMYYIKNGLGPKFMWLAVAFALFGIIGSLSTGNAVQANSIGDALKSAYGDVTIFGIEPFNPKTVAFVTRSLHGDPLYCRRHHRYWRKCLRRTGRLWHDL